MANIGKLNVTLIANSGPFKKGLARAGNMADRFAGRMKKFGEGASRVMGNMSRRAALVGAVFAGAMVLGINKARTAIDDLAKSSRKLLGNSGATGALAGLRLAAGYAGVSVAELDTGVEKMLETIGKAKEGDATAIKALKRVGVTAKELAQASPERRLEMIAEGIKNIGDVGDRVTAARGIFGRGGGSLTLLFQGGAQAIAGARREAELFGHSLTAKASGGVEKMNDNFAKLGAIMDGAFIQLTAKIAPVINDITDALIDNIDAAGGMGEAVEKAFDFIIKSGGTALNAIEDIELGWLKAKKAFLGYNETKSRALSVLTGSEERGKRTAEKRILSGIPPEHRAEAKRLLDAAGGAENEKVTFGRSADAYAAEAAEAQARIDQITGRQRDGNGLGDRFEKYIYKAQEDAENFAGSAADDRLGTEKAITAEKAKQVTLNKDMGEASVGSARLASFRGPTYSMERNNDRQQVDLLRQIADNTGNRAAVMA